MTFKTKLEPKFPSFAHTYRATLYHLGVLARLADADALRHVEAISCVSGGAIVGAHYFLLLRNLLERKRDADITREDYIAVVAQTIDDITAFTSKSLIWRLLLDAPSDAAVTMRLGSRVPAAGKCIEAGLFARCVDVREGLPSTPCLAAEQSHVF